MKYIIIVLISTITLDLNAQGTDDHFVLEEGKVSWQKVYETKKTKNELIAHFKNSGLFKLFRVEEGKIIATMRPQEIDKDEHEIAGTLPPPLLIKTKFAGSVIIGLKEGKYRVTFKNILLVGNGELIKKGEKQKFETHFVTKDGNSFRISFNKKPKTIYNLRFNQLFLLEIEKPKDDW